MEQGLCFEDAWELTGVQLVAAAEVLIIISFDNKVMSPYLGFKKSFMIPLQFDTSKKA